MKGRTVLVTGANTGMGKATATAIARMGAHVVLLCRNEERGKAAQSEIKALTGNESVDLMLCDLSSAADIRAFAADFMRRYPALHVLINNAGVVRMRREETKEGYEADFMVNHLAPFLLTNLLLDLLKKSAPSRIVMVNSGAHAGNSLDFDDLQSQKHYGLMSAYGRSKLANLLYAYELARRLVGTGVTVNALHPGAVTTDLWVDRKTGFGRFFKVLIRPFFRAPEKGAETIVYLATSPEVEGRSGLYWFDREPRRSSEQSYDTKAGERLWEISERLTAAK